MNPTTRKEQFNIAYVHAIATVAGVAATRPAVDDDSVDLYLSARGGRSPVIEAQLKCTENETRLANGALSFLLSIKNYEDLRRETMSPRILVVVVVPPEPAGWLKQTSEHMVLRKAGWWLSLRGLPEVAEDQQSVTAR
jgi:Domain of unknown function (DUF4365)